jgi:hypothetical protein
MAKPIRVDIADGAKASLRGLFAQRQQVEQMIQAYVKALQDTLDIQGEGWSLNIAEMAFIRESPNGKVEADVVGATTGNTTGE